MLNRYPTRLLGLAGFFVLVAPLRAQNTLPDRLADSTFWKLVTSLSEPAGYFQSENYTSNETGFQVVIPELMRTTKPGGVYLGVGPEQNFTYIVALKPRMVFITDIRQQNLVQHLVYKSLMEMSETRADFLSRLFSRPRPAGLDTNSSVATLFASYERAPADSALRDKNRAEILELLTKKHHFALSDSEVALVGRVISAFYQAGPAINYNFKPAGEAGTDPVNLPGRGGGGGGGGGRTGRGGGGMANYSLLMNATDGQGVNRSYLASEANYRAIRDLEMRNMLVPVIGNFGGPTALRAVGTYLKEHGATVTAMYCSNVEQYLFQYDIWRNFYNSIATLPLDSVSTFIRSGFPGGGGGGFGGSGMSSSLLASMQATVAAFKAGKIYEYSDILAMGHTGNH